MANGARLGDIEKLLEQLKEPRLRSNFYLFCKKMNVLYTFYIDEKDYENADKWAKLFIKECKGKDLLELSETRRLELLNDVRSAYIYLGGRGYFHYFLLAMEFDRPLKERFYQPRMKQLKKVVQDLQDLYDRKIVFYLLEMPPRVGKTTIGLFFLAMCIGLHPNKSSLTASYAGYVASTFYDGILEFISDPRYNFSEIFPDSPIVDTDSKNMSLDLKDKQRYKSITFRSIDGQITGALEANDIMYFDDLIQNIEEAKNIDRLDKAWDKVTVDLFQRMKPEEGCVLLAIGTNWSDKDPLTRLSELYKDNPKARVHRMPALDDDTDESNFDYDYGVGFSTEYYRNLRDNVYKDDPVSFNCIYQQKAMERVALDFPSDILKRYKELPPGKPDRIISFVDCAFGGGDCVSMPVCYMYKDTGYIVDFVYDSRTYNYTEREVANMILKHKVTICNFESNNGGEFYCKDVKELLKNEKHRCKITSERSPSTIAKWDRIEQYSVDILNFYFKDESLYERNSPYAQAMRNLTTYSSKARNPKKHDDCPDSLAGLSRMIRRPKATRIKSYSRSSLPFM